MSTASQLREYLGRSRARGLVRAAYEATIAAELLGDRVADALLAPRAGQGGALLDRLTLVVKTFERPRVLRRLVRSIRRFYPRLEVIVVDDSREPLRLPGVTTVTLPFNIGLSAGRAAALERVQTPYVLVLDDDFVFYRKTRLDPALALMEAEPRIDIMGGMVVNLPLRSAADYRGATLFPTDARPVHPIGSRLAGLEVYDKIANFFIARTDRLRLVGFDARLRLAEHSDFFTRARGVLTTVYNPELRCLHARTPFDPDYMAFRMDMDADTEVLRERYGQHLFR